MTEGSYDGSDSSTRLIKLDGEYDLRRKDEVAGLFGSLDGESSVVIDMTKVTFIDSTFLRELRHASAPRWSQIDNARRCQ